MATVLTRLIIISVMVCLVVYWIHHIKITQIKRELKDPKFFFMVPELYYLFSSILDISNYNPKVFFEAVDHADSFCRILFLLKIHSESSNDQIKRSYLLERLDYFRLQTVNSLESLTLVVLPEQVILNKLKAVIDLINSEMVAETSIMYESLSMDYSERPSVRGYSKELGNFFVN
jgi:hypothetical protein